MAGRGGGRGLYYGWYVVGAAFLANFMTTGTSFYVFNAFMLPLGEGRGWGRVELNVAPMIGFACGLLGQFAYGSLMDRVGPRRFMAVGPLAGSAAFILLGRVHSLAAFYVLYACLQLGNGALGGLVANTVVSNWFEARRGKALGLATAGISVSGMVLPPVAAWLVGAHGLETAFLVIGGSLALMSPLCLAVVRDGPESLGLPIDGWTPPPARAGRRRPAGAGPLVYWGSGDLLRTAAFWRLGLSYGLVMLGVMGVMYQLGPRLMDQGFGSEAALGLLALTTGLGAAGKYAWGHMCDRFDPRRVVTVLMALVALGLLLGVVARDMATAIAFVVIFGFPMGGLMSTMPIMAAHLFGRLAFASVFRFLIMFLMLQALGYLAMGLSYSLWGSYDAAYLAFAVLALAAALLVLSLPARISPPGRSGPAAGEPRQPQNEGREHGIYPNPL